MLMNSSALRVPTFLDLLLKNRCRMGRYVLNEPLKEEENNNKGDRKTKRYDIGLSSNSDIRSFTLNGRNRCVDYFVVANLP